MILVLPAALQGLAQQLSAMELMQVLKCTTNSCLHDKVVAKGFEPGVVKETEDYSLFVYNTNQTYRDDSTGTISQPTRLEQNFTGQAYIVNLNYFTGGLAERKALEAGLMQHGFVPDTQGPRTAFDNVSTVYYNRHTRGMKLVITDHTRTINDEPYMEYSFKLQWLPKPPRNWELNQTIAGNGTQ